MASSKFAAAASHFSRSSELSIVRCARMDQIPIGRRRTIRRGARVASANTAPGIASVFHSFSARARAKEMGREGTGLSLTARTRAPASSGKVTMEISQRSTASSLRMRVFGSMRPFTVRKPMERPSLAPAR
jgi:hypothetical protein